MKPSSYKYTLPEGFEIKPEHRKKLDALVKKTKLTNKQAQQFIDLHIEILSGEQQ